MLFLIFTKFFLFFINLLKLKNKSYKNKYLINKGLYKIYHFILSLSNKIISKQLFNKNIILN